MGTVLYQFWRSTASWRVRWALTFKGIQFEVVSVDLIAGEQHGAEQKARSPLGTVPVLCIDGRCLSESVAIIHYLEDTVPQPPLFPSDPWARGRTRQIMEIVNSAIQPMQIAAVRDKHSPDEDERKAWVKHFNERGLAACENLLTTTSAELGIDGPFAVGDRLTAADLFLVPQLYHARRFAVGLTAFPRLLRAERAALATQHAAGTYPDHQPGAPRSEPR